ncbi:hypothetical protein NO995_16080 [Aestuariibaculum sp. M13]|uniref:hypothetical protein n=1 Tax=Aestuariibaculum sp. M13 TaxID=2967132 RepID=UPI002159DE54|nr:hypothetical protein [Aestuariibaculum sp. M13]MCR8669206.1 hypothetical protein [Aestuariibaculum sp. M13]
MKTRYFFIFAITVLMLNSCIVKSLYPFYTKETLAFEKSFLGIWKDDKDSNNEWIIASIKDYWEEERKHDTVLPSPREIEDYNKLKEGYFVISKQKKGVAIFFAMPFKIKNQFFLDFIPFTSSCDCCVDLYCYHQIATHSLVKFDILNNNSVSIRWFSSEKMNDLIDNHKINIKHEKYDSNYLLTASPEELQKFIAKFMDSKEKEKWKTDVAYNLERTESGEKSFQYIKKLINGEEKLKGINLN